MGKAQKGYLYDANYDKEIVEARTRCADLCYEFNQCKPSDVKKQQELLAQILGSIKGNPVIAAGNPCKVIRKITEADKKKYPIFEESVES